MIKSQSDLNPCNDGKRSSEVLLATVAKCERLQKQLDFAKQAMLSAAGFLTCNPKDMQEIYPDFCAEQWALDSINKGLKQIKELNK